MARVGDIVFPGDNIEDLKPSEKTGKSLVGPGLLEESSKVTVSKPGILKFKEPNVYWVESVQKRVSTPLSLEVHTTIGFSAFI